MIKKGDIAALRAEVLAGCDVNTRNRTGWTPLMVAAGAGQTHIVAYLLSQGADLSVTNNHGASALAYAALEGHCRTVQFLLKHGAAVDVRPHGRSITEFAGYGRGLLKTVRHLSLLREAGAT